MKHPWVQYWTLCQLPRVSRAGLPLLFCLFGVLWSPCLSAAPPASPPSFRHAPACNQLYWLTFCSSMTRLTTSSLSQRCQACHQPRDALDSVWFVCFMSWITSLCNLSCYEAPLPWALFCVCAHALGSLCCLTATAGTQMPHHQLCYYLFTVQKKTCQ